MTIPFFRSKKTLQIFLLLAAFATLLTAAAYAGSQQVYRLSANDPQVQYVEEITQLLEKDVPADSILNTENATDMGNNLQPFVAVYDKDGKPVGASAKINGQIPGLPAGALASAKNQKQTSFTWQPSKDLRLAAVLRQANNDKGFALAARSLREVDRRISDLNRIFIGAWIASLILSGLLASVLGSMNQNNTIIEETNIIVEEKKDDDVVV